MRVILRCVVGVLACVGLLACGSSADVLGEGDPPSLAGLWAGNEDAGCFWLQLEDGGAFRGGTVSGMGVGTYALDESDPTLRRIEFMLPYENTLAQYRGYIVYRTDAGRGTRVHCMEGIAWATGTDGVAREWCWWIARDYNVLEGDLAPLWGWHWVDDEWRTVDAPARRLQTPTEDGQEPLLPGSYCPDRSMLKMGDE